MAEGFDLNMRLDDIIDAQLERVSVARDAVTDGLSVLNWVHLIMFPSSWYCFYWLGKMYFEKYLGVYHATSAKHWSTLCKLIFLLTFVTACNLLELMVFEILDLLPPALRRLAWSSTFVLLCILLNNIIPFVVAATMGRTLGLRRLLYAMLGIGCVVFVQIWFWIVGETFIADGSETWKDHSSRSVLIFLWNQLLLTDVQHSIALIAMMGTGVAAVVAGFATVSFPVEQLMIVRGVNLSVLRAKEHFHVDLLRAIARKKRESLRKYESTRVNNSSVTTDSESKEILSSIGTRIDHRFCSSAGSHHHQYREIFHKLSRERGATWGDFSETFEPLLHLWQRLDTALMGLLQERPSVPFQRTARRTSKLQSSFTSHESYYIEQNQKGWTRSSFYEYKVDLVNLEKRSQETFLDIVHMHELQRQIKLSKTTAGRALWIFGLWMSIVAILRLAQGAVNVGGYLFYGSKDWHGDGDKEHERSDFDNVLSFLESTFQVHIYTDNWHLILHCLFVGALGLMQIRAFLGTMGQLARMGFLSTNTELYALVLAYLSGFYFIASIVLLRTQLPLNYRKGVTVALGPFGFDFFAWVFDCIFVISTTVTVLGLIKTYAFKKTI